jgi:hypothetical protein
MIFVDELEGYVRSLGNNLSGYTLSNEDWEMKFENIEVMNF